MSEAPAHPQGSDPAATQASGEKRSDPRPWIYAGFDLLLAALYAYLLFGVIPNRHAWVAALSGLVVLAPLVMAGSMIARRPWSWWSATLACAALLLLALTFLILTLVSASFLAGVYGSIGRAAATFALIGAALVVEFMGILPALQMKFLMTRAGRRCFGKEPLWP